MERNYCVYKHTTPSGKVYIGLTGTHQKNGGIADMDIETIRISGTLLNYMVGKI